MTGNARPKLAVWKLASCDGCQLTLLDCEDELLSIAGAVEIAKFTEATRAEVEGPYDVSLVEGSVTTERDALRIVDEPGHQADLARPARTAVVDRHPHVGVAPAPGVQLAGEDQVLR